MACEEEDECKAPVWLVRTILCGRSWDACGTFDKNQQLRVTTHDSHIEALERLFQPLTESWHQKPVSRVEDLAEMLREDVAGLLEVELEEDKSGVELQFVFVPLHHTLLDGKIRILYHRDNDSLQVRLQGWGVEKCECFYGVLTTVPRNSRSASLAFG